MIFSGFVLPLAMGVLGVAVVVGTWPRAGKLKVDLLTLVPRETEISLDQSDGRLVVTGAAADVAAEGLVVGHSLRYGLSVSAVFTLLVFPVSIYLLWRVGPDKMPAGLMVAPYVLIAVICILLAVVLLTQWLRCVLLDDLTIGIKSLFGTKRWPYSEISSVTVSELPGVDLTSSSRRGTKTEIVLIGGKKIQIGSAQTNYLAAIRLLAQKGLLLASTQMGSRLRVEVGDNRQSAPTENSPAAAVSVERRLEGLALYYHLFFTPLLLLASALSLAIAFRYSGADRVFHIASALLLGSVFVIDLVKVTRKRWKLTVADSGIVYRGLLFSRRRAFNEIEAVEEHIADNAIDQISKIRLGDGTVWELNSTQSGYWVFRSFLKKRAVPFRLKP